MLRTIFASRVLRVAALSITFASATSAAEPGATVPPSDVDAVLSALQGYEAAYEALDVSRVRHVLPSLVRDQVERIRRSFADLASYEIEVRNARVDVRADVAIVDALVARRMVPRVGRPVANETETRFHLRRELGRWVIAAIPAPTSQGPVTPR